MRRAATRYATSQYPWISHHPKVPGRMPADMNSLAAWKSCDPLAQPIGQLLQGSPD